MVLGIQFYTNSNHQDEHSDNNNQSTRSRNTFVDNIQAYAFDLITLQFSVTQADTITHTTNHNINKMPSHLRLQTSFEEPISAQAVYHKTSPSSPPTKKQKMSLTQTYYIASTARSKLGQEAAKADHNLRRLVGSANLLDSLMLELAQAEREQEQWFNASVRKASKPDQPRRVQWIDTIVEEEDEHSDSDSDSDMSDDEQEIDDDFAHSITTKASKVAVSSTEIDEDDEDDMYEDMEEEEDDFEGLQLTRAPSRHSPPELTHEEESDSDEEDLPSSPEDTPLPLSDKQRAAIATTAFYDVQSQHQQRQPDFASQHAQQLVVAC